MSVFVTSSCFNIKVVLYGSAPNVHGRNVNQQLLTAWWDVSRQHQENLRTMISHQTHQKLIDAFISFSGNTFVIALIVLELVYTPLFYLRWTLSSKQISAVPLLFLWRLSVTVTALARSAKAIIQYRFNVVLFRQSLRSKTRYCK